MGDWHIKDSSQIEQTACAHAVAAVLVFLNLLEAEADRLGQLFLLHAEKRSPLANPPADVDVDGIRETFAGHAA